jgi:hypothetical protein
LGSLCIERSSGAFTLTTNIKQAENATGYISTNTINAGKSALKLGSTGLFYATASASVVPIGDSVSLTDRFVITNAGNVGIGTTSPSYVLDARGAVASTSAGGIQTVLSFASDGIVGTTSNHSFTFFANNAEKARIDTSGRLLVGTSSDSGGALLQVNGDRVRVATAKTPASASDTGTTGEICWDANYIYVCTATNTWKRSAISTW